MRTARTAIALVGGLFLIIGLSIAAPQLSAASPPDAPTPSQTKVDLPPGEKDYLQKATAFLTGIFEADKAMAACMQQAHDSAMLEVKQVVERSQQLQNDLYANYQTAPPPAAYQEIHAQITRYAELRTAAFQEMLRSWQDNNIAHMQKGGEEFLESMRLGAQCLQELDKHMAR